MSWQPISRVRVIQHYLKAQHRYLEIGCNNDEVFSRIQCAVKVGVDPVQGGTHRITSNEFFATNTETFDVIFIDGLHHYDQVTRDFEHSLDCLDESGTIIIHDMLPDQESQTLVPRPENHTTEWLGDVWRLGFDLMARDDIQFQLFTTDAGCGVVSRGHQHPRRLEVQPTWAWYRENWGQLPLARFTG